MERGRTDAFIQYVRHFAPQTDDVTRQRGL